MIHDATVTVSCDGGCGDEIEIPLEWKYRSMSSSSGFWSDDDVEDDIEAEGWVVADENHYCEECKSEYTEATDEND